MQVGKQFDHQRLRLLRRNVACASPYLSCLFETTPLDPQLKTIIRCLLFWRRFFKKFPGTRVDFCNRLAGDYKGHGPAVSLKKSLQVIGWSSLSQGWIAHTSGTSLNWICASKSFLKRTLRECWSFHVAEKTSHRKDFDLHSIDEYNMRNILRKRSTKHRSVLVAHCTGAAYTKSAFSKYDFTVDENCECCKTKDTREHRLLYCKKFQETRKGKSKLIKWVEKSSTTVRNLALMPIREKHYLILERFQKAWPVWSLPDTDAEWCHTFCDGSAFMQDQPTCVLAGAAAIRVTPNTDEYIVIAAQPIPGTDHSSYRGEAYAIYLVLQNISRPIIYSDCQSVVTQLSELLEAHQHDQSPRIDDHCDIWNLIWEHVAARPKGWIKVVKTKAHCNPGELTDQQLIWEAKANNFVDEIAKRAVTEWKDVFPQMDKRYKEIITEKSMMKQLHDLLLDQADISMDSQNKSEANTVSPTPETIITTSRKPNPLMCQAFQIVIPQLPCKFGDTFMGRVKTWAEKLTWPAVTTGHVSLLELYIDFTLFTKSLCPVPIGGSKGVKVQKYVLKDLDPSVITQHQTLAQQNVIWIRFLRWISSIGFVLWPYPIIKQSNCLSDLGYSLWTPALGTHPCLTMGDKAYRVLASLLRTPAGKRRKLDVAYNGDSSSLL